MSEQIMSDSTQLTKYKCRLPSSPRVSNHRKDTESAQELTKMSSSATKVQRPRLVATYYRKRLSWFSWRLLFTQPVNKAFFQWNKNILHHQQESVLTACLACMFADPSTRMFLKMGFRVLNTSSLSMPEPSWIHSRQAKEAAARCSSPLPDSERGGHSIFT